MRKLKIVQRIRGLCANHTHAKFQNLSLFLAFLYHYVVKMCDVIFFTSNFSEFYTSFKRRSCLVSSVFLSNMAVWHQRTPRYSPPYPIPGNSYPKTHTQVANCVVTVRRHSALTQQHFHSHLGVSSLSTPTAVRTW